MAKNNLCSIAGLGDSLTYGWSVRIGFFDRAIDSLTAARRDLDIRSRNLGVPGDTVGGGLSRLGALLGQGHHFITVQFGINDCYCGESVGTFFNNYKAITTRIIESGAVPILVCSSPLFDEEELIAPYYNAIRDISEEFGVPLADLDKHWRRHALQERSSLFLADAVHPTDAGHALMSRGLCKTLIDALTGSLCFGPG